MEINRFSRPADDLFEFLSDPIFCSEKNQEPYPHILNSDEILNLSPKIRCSGDLQLPLELTMFNDPHYIFDDTQEVKDASMSLLLNDTLDTEHVQPLDCMKMPNAVGSNSPTRLVHNLKEGNVHHSLPISNIDPIPRNFNKEVRKYDEGGSEEDGNDEVLNVFFKKPDRSNFQPPLELSVFAFPDDIFDRKNAPKSSTSHVSSDKQDFRSSDLNSTAHGFDFSPADISEVMTNNRTGHEAIPIVAIKMDAKNIDKTAFENHDGGLGEPDAEDTIRLFLENPSTGDFQPSLEFPMFSVPYDFFGDGQEQKDSSMTLSGNKQHDTKDLLVSECVNKRTPVSSSPACIYIENLKVGREDILAPSSDMERVRNHVGESTLQNDNGRPAEISTRAGGTDVLDVHVASLTNFQHVQKYTPDVTPCSKEPISSVSIKKIHAGNDSAKKKSIRREKQTTPIPHLRVIPFIEKGGRRFQCRHCNAAFTRTGNLKRHVDCVHNNIKRFECPTCSMKCSTKQNLEAHQKTHFRMPSTKKATQNVS